MKHTLHRILAGLALVWFPLHSEEFQSEDFSQVQITPNQESQGGPFKFEVNYDFVGNAKFNKKRIHKEHIRFAQADINSQFIFHYNKDYKEGAFVGLGYNWYDMHWSRNPGFTKKNFKTISFSLAGFSERCCDWLWIGQVTGNIDADHPDFSEYLTWDILVWGRYAYCNNIGINIGFLAQTGMKIDRCYPVVGVDWQCWDNLKLSAVYPVNISAVYTINCHWSVDVAARFFDFRDRAGPHAHLRKAVFHYQNSGAEFGVNYEWASWLHANAHIGYTFGGTLKIANQHNHHPHHFKFGSAGYAGAEVDVRF